MVLTQGLLTTLVVMYYFTLYYIVKPTHLYSRGGALPHVEAVVVLLHALLQEDHGKSSNFVNQALFQHQD